MDTIHAIYFDGKTSNKQPIEIYLDNNFLRFNILPKSEFAENHQWDINKIERQDFTSSNKLILSYGNFPKKAIQINGLENIVRIKEAYPPIFNQNLLYNSVLDKNKWKFISAGLVLLVGFFLFYYLVLSPILSEKIVDFFPIKTEIDLGNRMTNTLLEEMKLTGVKMDDKKSKLLNQFFEKSGFKSKYPVKIYYVKEELVNAFAVPGGGIFVYEGILDKTNQWQDLSGLLAHELSHVDQRHSLKGLSKNLSNYFILSLITSDISGIAAIFIDNAAKLHDLSNSRSYEKEADLLGFNKLIKANINPQGMVNLFTQMQKQEDSLTNKQKEYLSFMVTHPLTSQRIDYLKDKIKKEGADKSNYSRRIDLEFIYIQLKKK